MQRETYNLHITLGLQSGRESTCGKKVDYKSEPTASKAAASMMRKGSKELEAYPCAFCSGWHIGRKMT